MTAPATRTPLRGAARGRLADPLFKAAVTAAAMFVLFLLAFMIIRTTADSWPIFAKEGLGFFTGTDWKAGQTRDLPDIHGTYGALPFMYGTLVTSLIALALALPVAVAVALFITQIAPRRLRNPLSYTVETLAAVPSIVYGLWGLLFFLPVVIRPAMERLHAWFGGFFLFEGPVFGLSYFAAGVVLSIMILPIITAIIRRGLRRRPERRDARRLRAGGHPLGGDPQGAAATQLLRRRRGQHARPGPSRR